jgi:hypothetical protein
MIKKLLKKLLTPIVQEVLQDEIKKRETSSESFMKELGKALSVVCDVSYNVKSIYVGGPTLPRTFVLVIFARFHKCNVISWCGFYKRNLIIQKWK